MFRNVTNAEESVRHAKHSDESLPIEIIHDVQSTDVVENYSIMKNHWRSEREHWRKILKSLEKTQRNEEDIQSVKNLIECLNTLIDQGELSKHCQSQLDQMKNILQPIPSQILLPRKDLTDKLIRLPRHVQATSQIDLSTTTTVKKFSSDLIRLDRLKNIERNSSNRKISNGIQFYLVAEPFRPSIDRLNDDQRKRKSSTIE